MQYFILFITLLISTNSWGINTPVNMSPSNGALNRPTTMALDWTNITGNTGYLYELDTTPNFNSSVYVVGNTSGSNVTLSDLLFGTTYYWRAATKGPVDTSAYGTTWSFTTQDNVTNTSPSNGATNRFTTTTIDWSSMTGNNGYLYELDTSPTFNSTLYEQGATGVNASNKALSNLLFGTTYYWRAAVMNTNDTSSYGATWSFTTQDNLNNTSPSNGATNRSTTTTIDWFSMTGNNGYIYELDTSPTFNSALYEQGATGVNASNKILSNLYFGTTYYWRAAVMNTNDTSNYGATWSFTTQDAINYTSPSNGATNRSTTTTIDWSSMTGNNGYLYELDTSPTFNSALYEQGATGVNASNKALSNLLFGTTYYWRAAVMNTNDTSGYGVTWSFTTQNAITNTSPSNGATNRPTTTTIDWSSMTGNNGYLYELDTSPNFNSALYEQGATGVNASNKALSNLLFGTTYYWRAAVMNTNDTSSYGATWSFTTQDNLNNTSPSNGATNRPTTTTIDWSSMTGNNGYLYELDTSPTFNSALYEQGATAVNASNKALSNLYFGTTYYWRAAVLNTNDTSNYGATWSFTTQDDVTNTSPTNGATNRPTTTTIDWSSMTGNNGYLYELDTSPNFNSALYEQGGTGVNTSAKSLSNLLFGTTYYWRAAVTNTIDTSNYGATWSFTTEYQLLLAPVLVSPLDVSINIPVASTALVWDSIANVNSYEVMYSTNSSFTSGVNTTTTTQLSTTITNLTGNTTYYWRVRGTNNGGHSPWSTVWSFTTEAQVVVTAPILVSPLDAAINIPIASIQLVWDSIANGNSYEVMYSTDVNFMSGVSTTTTTQLNTTITNLMNNTTYYWRVRGTNSVGQSAWSTVWSFTTEAQAVVTAPILVSPLDASINIPIASIQLVWDSIANGNSYEVMYSTDVNFMSGVSTATTTQLNTTITNLTSNTTYYWRVRGTNSVGQSAWSTVWSFTTEVVMSSIPSFVFQELTIYPNPVQELLTINVGLLASYHLTITNIQGQLIDAYQFNGTQLKYNTAKLAAGVYVIKVSTKGTHKSLKFIKN